LTPKQLFALDGDGNLESTLMKGEKYIDFAVVGDKYFLLDEKNGLKIGFFSNSSLVQTYTIVSIESVKKIKVFNAVLFLIY
jgi:hypothetical protein